MVMTEMSLSADARIEMLDIGRVLPHPLNPRGEVMDDDVLELMRSVKEKGVLQPLVVAPFRDAFRVVAGHRRRHACKLAGMTKVPCIVREMGEDEQLDLMLVENIQRRDLTPIQEARGFQALLERGATVQDLVRRLGLSKAYIEPRLVILSLAPAVQSLFELGTLPVGAARVLALTPDHGRQKHYATLALQRQMPLGKLEELVREQVEKPKKVAGRAAGRRKRALSDREVFVRSDAERLLDAEPDAVLSFRAIREALDDVCLDVCTEDDNREMCEACPVPRLLASVLRKAGREVTGRGAA